MNERPPLIRIVRATKRFGHVSAVFEVSLDVFEGEFFGLLGPSGCGKTTLLRMLAGFEQPDSGVILLDGQDMADVPPYLRPVNMMFQSYALFPHFPVAGNIAFGLKREGMPKALIAARVAEMVSLVKLEGLEARMPHQLSGGQRQRVALARALAKRPRLLLLDEPMAALDKKLRAETQIELADLQRRLGLTFMIVTHDQQEAMSLATRIGVMSAGSMAQVGTPIDVYEAPANRSVAEFIGDVTVFEGVAEITAEGSVVFQSGDLGRCTIAGELPEKIVPGHGCLLAIRPEKIVLAMERQGTKPPFNSASGVVVDAAYFGDQTHLRVRLDSGKLVKVSRSNSLRGAEANPDPGERVGISFAMNAGILLAG